MVSKVKTCEAEKVAREREGERERERERERRTHVVTVNGI